LQLYSVCIFLVCLHGIGLLTGCSNSGDENTRIDGFYFSFDDLALDGPMVYSGQVSDYSGNNFHGNAISIAKVPGKIGSGAEFGLGEESSIALDEIPGYFPFDSGFTFKAWLKMSSGDNSGIYQIIGSKTDRVLGSRGDGFGIGLTSGGSRIYFELPEEGAYSSSLYQSLWNLNLISESVYSLSPSVDVSTFNWFHIAVTYDGETLSYYYNGDLVATDAISTSFTPGFYNHIGNMGNAKSPKRTSNSFSGVIDELYLDSRVMSSQEIMDYYLDTM
jgi:Concanavalin A-like lectin/glucanases superfamily